MQHRTGRALSVAALATATAVVVMTAASAAPASPSPLAAQAVGLAPLSTRMATQYGGYPLHVSTLTDKVVAPLQLSVSKSSASSWATPGQPARCRSSRGGQREDRRDGPQPGEISGVDVNRHGDIAYTSLNYTTHQTGLKIPRKGQRPVRRPVRVREEVQPGPGNHYGTTSTTVRTDFLKSADCPPVSYTGMVDSHPYAVAAVRGGWVVADAAGNDLLFVDSRAATSRCSPSCRRSPT